MAAMPKPPRTMATRKRNEWLDAEESEDEEKGYDSEDESRARLLRNSKRQKVTHDSGSEDENEENDFDDEEDEAQPEFEADDDDIEEDKEIARLQALAAALPSSARLSHGPLSLSTKQKKDKSGIIYLSRCPQFMKPSVVRSLLTPYGPVGRVFLTPEPTTQRTQRLRSGGTRRKLFLDGWVEFLHKRDAKFVAQNLNAQTMGGKKRGRWHDEVWNIKYLSGVKWSHLVEQIQNENAERQARMRTEIAQSKRENARFLEDIERGKIAKTMAERRKTRGGGEDKDAGEAEEATGGESKKRKPPRREFKQNEVKFKAEKKPEPGQDVQNVLSKLF
jgi:ESF2/ABP1 family protein